MDNNWSDKDMMEFAEQYRFSSSRISLDLYKKSKEVKKDKEYEVLSYIDTRVITDIPNGNVISAKNNLVAFYDLPIHSVKRLPDNEVFTIGDKVKYTYGKCNYDFFEIDNFFINSGECLVRNKYSQICEWITEIEKVKKEPFFTKEQQDEIISIINKWQRQTAKNK